MIFVGVYAPRDSVQRTTRRNMQTRMGEKMLTEFELKFTINDGESVIRTERI